TCSAKATFRQLNRSTYPLVGRVWPRPFVRYLTLRPMCRTIGILAAVNLICLCNWPAMEATPEAKRQAAKVIKALARDYADAECALNFDSPVQLLVATILSAQCTDERVNIVTKELFADYPTAEAIANLPLPKLEKIIASTGFFRNKAKNIKAACQVLV